MSQLDAISLASSTIGFISFAFTFFTFIRVFWETILALLSAPKQMRAYLDNLRLEIHNERAYFKSALRRTKSRSRSIDKSHEDEHPLITLNRVSDQPFGVMGARVRIVPDCDKACNSNDCLHAYQYAQKVFQRGTADSRDLQAVRRIHHEFNRLEAPFLIESPETTEKDVERSDTSAGTDYAPMTLFRRWRWMRSKSDIISMADQVNRIQTQRIACDASNILKKLHVMDQTVQVSEDILCDLEEHFMGERLDDGKIYVKGRVDRQ